MWQMVLSTPRDPEAYIVWHISPWSGLPWQTGLRRGVRPRAIPEHWWINISCIRKPHLSNGNHSSPIGGRSGGWALAPGAWKRARIAPSPGPIPCEENRRGRVSCKPGGRWGRVPDPVNSWRNKLFLLYLWSQWTKFSYILLVHLRSDMLRLNTCFLSSVWTSAVHL